MRKFAHFYLASLMVLVPDSSKSAPLPTVFAVDPSDFGKRGYGHLPSQGRSSYTQISHTEMPLSILLMLNYCQQTGQTIGVCRSFAVAPKQGENWLSNEVESVKNFFTSFMQNILDRRKAVAVVDLRSKMPPVYDQGKLGSCTANALGAALEYEKLRQGEVAVMPSRLQIYYSERALEGTLTQDAGASLSDGILVLHNTGTCSETLWPYSDDATRFKQKPSDACFKDAHNNRDLDDIHHSSVPQDLNSLKTVLSQGFPVVMGIQVYPEFESSSVARSGLVPLPAPHEQPIGGHAVLAVGFDDRPELSDGASAKRANPYYQHFIMRNSWGANWGDAGYFYLPYAYVTDPALTNDLWIIKKVGSEGSLFLTLQKAEKK